MRSAALLASLLALPAVAQDFETPNRQLKEKSFSRACDGFAAFLKASPGSSLAREASAKKAAACLQVGRGDSEELRKLADAGEKDFARAFAAYALFERGERGVDPALLLLQQAASGDDRVAQEARTMLVTAGVVELERNPWDPKRVEAMADLVIKYGSATDRAHARFLRARSRLQANRRVSDAEAELADVGAGQTEWADDALHLLAERRESEGKYTAALDLYDGIVKRFSPTTSNMRGSAASRAAEIRRPYVTVSDSFNDLPGMKPQLSVGWRNVRNAKWTLRRVDPTTAKAGEYPNDADAFTRAARETVSTWSSTLDVPAPHAPGGKSFELDVKTPGLYVLEVTADGQSARTWVNVTNVALATKTDRGQVLVFAADAETGVALPGAEVTLFLYRSAGAHQKLEARTNEAGLARFKVENAETSMVAFVKAGAAFGLANAGGAYAASYSREALAYIMTDRPLYKPGEKVGLKVFLRSREGGPSTPLAGRRFRLQVSDPQGKRHLEAPLVSNDFGTAHTELTLPKDAGLGSWSVYIDADEDSFRQQGQSFRVEEYKPPEYLVSVEPVGSPKPGEKVKVRVKASYYSGGAVANAQGRALVTVQPWAHQFGAWPDAELAGEEGRAWGDVEEEYGYRPKRSFWYGQLAQHTLPFKTGSDGTAELEIPATEGGYEGLEYSVQVFVTDASRREIQGQGSVRASRSPWFVDLRTDRYLYRPGERVTVRLRAEDANGRPADADVIVRLVRVGEDGRGARIAEARTRIVKGSGAVQLDADAIGQVRAEVLDPNAAGEVVLAQTDLWLTSDTKPMAPPGGGFQLFVDRAPLRVGGTVRALVATPRPGGHVLLSLESDGVHSARVVELKGRARFVELPLTADMAPNCWLTATRFEDANAFMQQLPVRVAGSEVELGVSVDFGRASAEPGSQLTPSVTAKGAPAGAALETSLTIVDEALFAIEPERTDFLRFFTRAPRQLSAQSQTSHSMRSYRARPRPQAAEDKAQRDLDRAATKDDVARSAPEREASSGVAPAPASAAPITELAKSAEAPPMPSRADKKAKGPGKDEGSLEVPVKVRTDFGTSAGWYPELAMKAGVPLAQRVQLKDSLTSWKAVATVVSQGPHLGQGAGTVRTAKALMVRLQAPRFFVEGDEVVLSAVVESHLAKATDVDVSILAPGFRELGPARKTVRVEPEQTLRFDARFKVAELGERTLRAVAKGGGTSDAMEWTLPAFVHGSAQRQFFAGRLADRFSFELELPEKRKPGLTRLELALSPSLLAVMFDGLPYLAQYPYGCVEQTLSRFVPATIARRAVKSLELPASRVPANLDDMTEKGLQRLVDFQHSDGGWGWWQSDHTNLWMTAYVVYALSLAQDAGLAIPGGVISRGREYLGGHLGEALNTPETHAFMVFALAATGGAPKRAFDALFARRTTLSPRARAQLALALLRVKDARARIAVENLDDIVKAAKERADAAVGDATDAWNTSAAIEATAFTLMAYARYDLRSPLIGPLTDFLVLRRNGGKWRSTRDTAFAIYALSELAKLEGAALRSGAFVVTVNGKEVKRLAYAKGGLDLTAPLVLNDAALKPGKNVVEVRRDGGGTGYYAATYDVFNMNDFIKGVGGDVKVKRTYTLLGKPSTERSAVPTEYGMPVESGVRVRVDVELTSNKAVEFVVLEDLKPAGFEAVQLRSGPEVCNYACAHAELRTDRVAMFLPEVRAGTTRLSYELRAEVPGRFAALPARVEAMYAPEIQATADEMRFEVRDAPAGVAAQ